MAARSCLPGLDYPLSDGSSPRDAARARASLAAGEVPLARHLHSFDHGDAAPHHNGLEAREQHFAAQQKKVARSENDRDPRHGAKRRAPGSSDAARQRAHHGAPLDIVGSRGPPGAPAGSNLGSPCPR
eukprot:10533022-Alexandrium_andersonii.AAC.1